MWFLAWWAFMCSPLITKSNNFYHISTILWYSIYFLKIIETKLNIIKKRENDEKQYNRQDKKKHKRVKREIYVAGEIKIQENLKFS